MSKNTIIYLVLVAIAAGSFLFKYIWPFPFFGGSVFGASLMLLFLNLVGQGQLNKATRRVDKMLKDRIVEIEKSKEDDND